MPLYDYRCPACNQRYELRLPVDHETPICGKPLDPGPTTGSGRCEARLVLMLHPPGLAFKGPGFHVNDYPKGDRHE